MSPACTRLGRAPSLPPSWRATQLCFPPTDPSRRGQICPQPQFMGHSKQEPLLWCTVGEGSLKLSPQKVMSPSPVQGDSDPVG